MGPVALAAALLGVGLQKPSSNYANFPDVPDNHSVYGLLEELKADGLLPELNRGLASGNRPLTRGQVGNYIVEATLNFDRFVDDHRHVLSSEGEVRYSPVMSDFSGDQLKYCFSLVPRLRKVAKQFADHLPSFVNESELDKSLEHEGKLIDSLLANE